MSRRPVFRRKRHAPECRPRLGEFQADLPLSGSRGTKKRHAAFLLFVRLPMLHLHPAALSQPRLQQHQRPMCIDRQRRCVFFELTALRIRAAYAHRKLHEYPLTPPAWTWIRVRIRRCGHGTSFSVTRITIMGRIRPNKILYRSTKATHLIEVLQELYICDRQRNHHQQESGYEQLQRPGTHTNCVSSTKTLVASLFVCVAPAKDQNASLTTATKSASPAPREDRGCCRSCRDSGRL